VQKAHDNGEFFTPSSLVQLIVNVIEPDHGTVFDPACGSGGMFVQSSHFIEQEGEDTAKKVVFYGQEKNPTTIRIAKMNLAVHGLEGKIAEAITYYQDEHTLFSKCDFVMANPPFNVDLVDAERIAKDPRLPFGLPGVNKSKKVSNGNYLWISYFWSYLNEHGRAGFVMSSQASSAGHGEKDVRKKIVETGNVDVMISIRSNFFYTRSVPCELWFFDRGKPKDRPDKVLMLDARNIYRKVTRKIYDFSPEHMQNLSAIIWLYRDQRERFLKLVKQYLVSVCDESREIGPKIDAFERTLAELREQLVTLSKNAESDTASDEEKKKAFASALTELVDAEQPYESDGNKLPANLDEFLDRYSKNLPNGNDDQHAVRKAFDPIAEETKGLIKQIDLLYKLAGRAVDLAAELALVTEEGNGKLSGIRTTRRLLKQLDEQRKAAVDQLKEAAYFHRQIVWLQDRFPNAELQAVPGLVKLVDRSDIENADWSLTPGHYVGVAPPEPDDDFDFEQTIRDIHTELVDLNKEAIKLAGKVQENFVELGV
jgi:type I restriction enzyme M protein